MADEKPIHVLVAEVLGYHSIKPVILGVDTPYSHEDGVQAYSAIGPGTTEEKYRHQIPRFDAETEHYDYEDYEDGWAALGPVIDKYGIGVEYNPWQNKRASRSTGVVVSLAESGCPKDLMEGERTHHSWSASLKSGAYDVGRTPLLAVCNLIVRYPYHFRPSPPAAAQQPERDNMSA